MTALVLVVDDRRELRELLTGEIEEVGLRVVQAADALQGWACYRRAEPDLVVTDLRMPRSGGIDLVRRIREVASTPVVVVATRHDDPASLLALRSGAEELITFPDDLGRLIDRVRRLTARCDPELAPADWLAGSSRRIRLVREQIARLATGGGGVLVEGECDRGREAAVAELHERGPWVKTQIVRLDAGSPSPLPVEGFVHLEGVERAGPAEQEAWRRALTPATDASPTLRRRIVTSTAVDLVPLVAAGRFDADLFAELARDTIEVPALRERLDDLRELVPALVRRLARLHGLHDARVPAPLVTALRRHAWPGSLDQLARVLQHAVERARDGVIALRDVEELLCDDAAGADTLREACVRRERDEIGRLHTECRGNLAEMARRLGVSRGSVVYRMQKLGLPVRSGRA